MPHPPAGRPKQSGMITRHFDHPSGGRATLEFPQGWSNACYFILTAWDAAGNMLTGSPERKSFETPDQARAGAAARERDALAIGWRPRGTSGQRHPPAATTSEHGNLYRQNGERIEGEITKLDMPEAVSRGYVLMFDDAAKVYDAHGPRAIKIVIKTDVNIERRDKLELIRPSSVTSIQVMSVKSGYGVTTINGHVREQRSNDPATQARVERERLITAFVNDTRTWNFTTLWQQIGLEPSEKTLVINEILKRRTEREAQARRQQEIAAQRQRELEQFMASERARRSERDRSNGQTTFLPKAPDAETKRKLSGGKDLGAPKPRKIDLGD
jgi:hypothetical protein